MKEKSVGTIRLIEVFSRRLSQMREERGLTMEELAKMAGLTKATISNYENKVNAPKLEHAIKLADALHISFSYLVGRSNAQYPVEIDHVAEIYDGLTDANKKELIKFADYLMAKQNGE